MSRPGPEDPQSDDGFLSRWSRRKRGEAPEAEASPAGPDAGTGTGAGAGEDTRTDAEILEELGLPDPETLRPGDDIRAFMAKSVPHRLRNRALRTLWGSNPVLANLDDLVDYGEDYTDAAMVVEGLATAWAVGRGYRPLEPEPEPEPEVDAQPDTATAEEVSADADPAPDDCTAADDAPDDPPADTPPEAEAADSTVMAAARPPEPAPQPAPPRRRRMRFS